MSFKKLLLQNDMKKPKLNKKMEKELYMSIIMKKFLMQNL